MIVHDHQPDDALDAALKAVARPDPPADHVARVLARTGIVQDAQRATRGDIASAPTYGRARWLMPALAASALVIAITAWLVDRATRVDVDDVLYATAPSPPLGTPNGPDLNLPVLPPQAYWAMDAFDEFASLRTPVSKVGIQQTPTAATSGVARGVGGRGVAGSQPTALPSSLPPIELEDISPAPLTVAPASSPDAITIADIEVAPIVIAPVIEEEKP